MTSEQLPYSCGNSAEINVRFSCLGADAVAMLHGHGHGGLVPGLHETNDLFLLDCDLCGQYEEYFQLVVFFY
jgi:hypothetical protein